MVSTHWFSPVKLLSCAKQKVSCQCRWCRVELLFAKSSMHFANLFSHGERVTTEGEEHSLLSHIQHNLISQTARTRMNIFLNMKRRRSPFPPTKVSPSKAIQTAALHIQKHFCLPLQSHDTLLRCGRINSSLRVIKKKEKTGQLPFLVAE